VFYVSIQLSALVAPLVTGFLGETVNWHLGFGAAGVGMTFGVVQFVLGSRSFGDVGTKPGHPASPAELRKAGLIAGISVAVVAAVFGADALAGTFQLMHVVMAMGLLTLISPVAYFLVLRRNPVLSKPQRGRVSAFGWVLGATALFWMFVIQANSLLSLFAQHSTDRALGGFVVPAGWFASATPLFMLVLAPLFAMLWTRIGDRVPLPVKIALGLAGAAASMLLMSAASGLAESTLVSPLWLIAVYLLLAFGEVVLAPVGLSASVDIAPASFAGRTMGLYWMCSAFGAGLGAQIVHLAAVLPEPVYYLILAATGFAACIALVLARRPLAQRLSVAAPETVPELVNA
ncbi:MAG TPA: oligopeptide:H+ symporter, partial [Amycolatopsis sp.]|nr:oligopeptide:H+ symporter [Amycolatopsis sp.]